MRPDRSFADSAIRICFSFTAECAEGAEFCCGFLNWALGVGRWTLGVGRWALDVRLPCPSPVTPRIKSRIKSTSTIVMSSAVETSLNISPNVGGAFAPRSRAARIPCTCTLTFTYTRSSFGICFSFTAECAEGAEFCCGFLNWALDVGRSSSLPLTSHSADQEHEHEHEHE